MLWCEVFNQILLEYFKGEVMRDLEREIKNMEEESENVKTIRDSIPNFCPKQDLCMENGCSR